jgi:23S rRNA (guanosine2251-2'-O)-methyltransferase
MKRPDHRQPRHPDPPSQGGKRPPIESAGSGKLRLPGPGGRPPRRPTDQGAEPARTGLWLYGLHAVAAALQNPSRRLRRLVVTEDAEAALATMAPPPWPLVPERIERARLDHLLGRDVVHQGVGLSADPLVSPTMAQALERPGPVLVLDQVTDPRNVGAILRSAAAFGAAAIVVQDRHAPDESGAMAKAASGALETMPLLRAVNIVRTLIALKAAGLWVVGLDAGAPPLSGTALAQRRIALVLGAEGEGLRRLTRETCDERAGLAMPGLMESLNVSAAAAVALYELRN